MAGLTGRERDAETGHAALAGHVGSVVRRRLIGLIAAVLVASLAIAIPRIFSRSGPPSISATERRSHVEPMARYFGEIALGWRGQQSPPGFVVQSLSEISESEYEATGVGPLQSTSPPRIVDWRIRIHVDKSGNFRAGKTVVDNQVIRDGPDE